MDNSRNNKTPCSTSNAVLDGYFIENRAKILDLAAFMDRFDRGCASPDAVEDHRWKAIGRAIEVLLDGQPERARRVLEVWSDPTLEPIDKATVKGATGAWSGISNLRV